MTHEELIQRISDRTGLDSREAERAAFAVLSVLGERLSRRAAEELAEELPLRIGGFLFGREHGQQFGPDELHARVSAREDIRLGFAIEHTAVVCETIAEALSPGALYRLREALPEDLARLFAIHPRSPRFERTRADARRHTLAEGRPGSGRPLYAARFDRAHTHSIALADNPHADTKLSSSPGLTQEREQETLASGKPGSTRPLSETRS
jgi:uncharacterized protein (DUF2267 family)